MNHKNIIWIIALLVLSSVSAIPVPIGIDGRVFELDGVTEVFEGVPVIINNTDSGQIIYTNTGRISSGRYSVAINGDTGDFIIVNTYNPLFSVSRNITLTGVTHNFDLVINMSLPPFPPNITSNPPLTALEDTIYSYRLKAFDWNNDEVNFSFNGPEGMVLNGDTLYWLPTQEDVGFQNVEIIANDGNLTGTQEFTLEVINVNDPPNITSTPVTKATAGRSYSYDVGVEDPDDSSFTHTLLDAPTNMSINSQGRITWSPQNVGEYKVIVEVSDGELTDIQEYEITVGENSPPEIISSPPTSVILGLEYGYKIEAVDADGDSLTYSLLESPVGMTLDLYKLTWTPTKDQLGVHLVTIRVSDGLHNNTQRFKVEVAERIERKRPGGAGGGGGGLFFKDFKPKPEPVIKVEKDGDKGPIVEIKFKDGKGGARAESLRNRPRETKQIENLVYKYLNIEKERKEDGGALIKFKVDNKWIKQRSVTKEDIVLARYKQDWEELPTRNTEEDKTHAYYESETPGFSFFAITIRKEVKADLPPPEVEVIKEPFVILGEVTAFMGRPVPAGTSMIVENLNTGEILYGETGEPTGGSYLAVLHGSKGDRAVIKVLGNYEAEVRIELRESKLQLDIKAERVGLIGITGRAIDFKSNPKSGLIASTLMLLLIGYFVFSYFNKYRKRPKVEELENLVEKVDSGYWGDKK